jgi:hypothetical protein
MNKPLKNYTSDELKKEVRKLRKYVKQAEKIIWLVGWGSPETQIKAARKWHNEYEKY